MVGNPPSRVLGGDDRAVVVREGATVGAPTLPLPTVGNGGAYGGVVVAHGGGENRSSPTLKNLSKNWVERFEWILAQIWIAIVRIN